MDIRDEEDVARGGGGASGAERGDGMRCGAGRGKPVRAPGAGAQPKVLEVLTMCDFASERFEAKSEVCEEIAFRNGLWRSRR